LRGAGRATERLPPEQALACRMRPRLLKGGAAVLWTIIAILLILWLLGVVALPDIGSLVHLLLVLALIVLVVQLLTGRRTVI
jgi:hypothetical protein